MENYPYAMRALCNTHQHTKTRNAEVSVSVVAIWRLGFRLRLPTLCWQLTDRAEKVQKRKGRWAVCHIDFCVPACEFIA